MLITVFYTMAVYLLSFEKIRPIMSLSDMTIDVVSEFFVVSIHTLGYYG